MAFLPLFLCGRMVNRAAASVYTAAMQVIVPQATHRMGSKILRKPAEAPVLRAMAAMSFIAVQILHQPFPWLMVSTGAVGGIASLALFS
jgi:hypothetical protein